MAAKDLHRAPLPKPAIDHQPKKSLLTYRYICDTIPLSLTSGEERHYLVRWPIPTSAPFPLLPSSQRSPPTTPTLFRSTPSRNPHQSNSFHTPIFRIICNPHNLKHFRTLSKNRGVY